MNTKRVWLAVPAAFALLLTACSGGNTPQSEQSQAAAQGKPILINGSEPQNPLIPADTGETGGGFLVGAMFAGLVHFNPDGTVENLVAKSIDNKDNQFYTVTLNKGWKFSDGTPVMAHNFTDAWKLATTKPMLLASFFSPIEGTNDQGTGDLSGVKVTGDYTFTIKLKRPAKDFYARLGHTAFYPLPDSTLKDPKEGGEHPVGNGPYMPDGKDAWQHRASYKLKLNPYYAGKIKPKNVGITATFYVNPQAAFLDLEANQLDVGGIPENQLATYKSQMPGRTAIKDNPNSNSFFIPTYVPHFSGDEGRLRRQAISYAINRQEIADKIYRGMQAPAKDFSSKLTPGYSENIPGSEVLTYNPEKAKELWAQADAISPWSGTLTFEFNQDSGERALYAAVADSIKNAIGIDAETKTTPDFKSFLDEVKDKKLTGAGRGGWSPDYPSLLNFLEPIYKTNASSNDSHYSNPEFDKLLDQAQLAKTDEEFNDTLHKAEEILFRDLPAIPLLNGKYVAAWSENVSNIKFGWGNGISISQLVKK